MNYYYYYYYQIPLEDSDYDTRDIINLSKELLKTASLEESKADSTDSSGGFQRKESFNIQDIIPPPPAHLLDENASSSAVSSPEMEQSSYPIGGQGHVTDDSQVQRLQGSMEDEGDYAEVSSRPQTQRER